MNWRGRIGICKVWAENAFKGLLRKNRCGFLENNGTETSLKGTLRKHISRDEAQTFSDPIRGKS